MIEFTKSYKTGDGQVFGSIEEAQIHELKSVILQLKSIMDGPVTTELATHILKNKTMVIDVLTTTPNSKPKARSSHGGTKNRTRRTVVTDAATSAANTVNAVIS